MKKSPNRKPAATKSPSSFFQQLLAIISWITVLLLWASAASALVSPIHFKYLSILGLAFPGFAVAVIGMLLVNLIFARRNAWIPLFGILGASFSLYSYCPINLPSPAPKGSLKILTYNTMGFAQYSDGTETATQREALLQYVDNCHPDIFCFQEGATVPDQVYTIDILNRTRKYLPYNDRSAIGGNILGCLSKYPIVGKDTLHCSDSNGAIVFRLLLGHQDTLHLVNCHLQSMGLSKKEREQYHDIVRSPNNSHVDEHSRLLISKISRATLQRSLQAESVAHYVEQHKGKNVIVCGDFNDTPISYAFHRLHSAGLTDAYGATANGIGRSFNRDAIFVRIDHLFCSEQWKPYSFKIDQSISASDHYPLVGYLKRVQP